jgi:hypothetical protein
MIRFGTIQLAENETVSFALAWLGDTDPDFLGNRGWNRLNQPLRVQARQGNRKNASLVAELLLSIEDSEIYGIDGALICTFPNDIEIPEAVMRFDIMDSNGIIQGSGFLELERRITQ